MRKWLTAIVLCVPLAVSNYQYRSNWLFVEDMRCIADNVYHEARGESFKGQVLVARVTLNRAKDTSICYEVYRYRQFSWTLHKKIKHNRSSPEYYTAWLASYQALDYDYDATHYHAVWVNPGWAKKKERIGRVGAHIFYK